jgi:thiamine-monophosphate kinase
VGSPKLERTPVLVEDETIERIRNALGGGSAAPGLRDDAAVLAVPGSSASVVVSVDSVVEGIHFDLALSSVHDVGWKALMSALSDVAAMGARPIGALVALCVPGLGRGEGTAVGVMEGVAEAAAAGACPVVGGDVSGGRELTVVVTVIGWPDAGVAVTRAGARPGDVLMVTGPCGGSAAGLRLLRAGVREGAAVARHRRPVARVAEGVVGQQAGVRAMIDVSDGLALDLHRLADASGIGFALDDVPVAEDATLDEALGGGEDYELVMAVAPADCDTLNDAFVAAGLQPPIRIGEATASPATRLLAGQDLGRLGFQHGGARPTG